MKHYWDEAAYIPSLRDEAAAWAVATRFRELRDDDFTGGFVLRDFQMFTSSRPPAHGRGQTREHRSARGAAHRLRP